MIACTGHDPTEFFEPALILLIVILNAIMGVVQENKAEKALDALKNMSAPHARVIRDGTEKIIAASDLVPGDIIKLEAGDFVPADARLISSSSLKSEESALTGESVPSEKDADAVVAADAAIGEIRKHLRKSGNFLFKERLYRLQRHVPLGDARTAARNDDVDAAHPFVDVTDNILFIIFYDSVIDDLMAPVGQGRLNHQAVRIIRKSPAIADS